MADPSGRPTRGRIIVFGILFWYPLAGVTYQFLHYLIGLRRLGYDVWYVEDSARYVYDPVLNDITPDADRNVAAVARVLEQHGFGNRWIFRGAYEGGRTYGQREAVLRDLYTTADAFLNVTGAQELRDEHLKVPCRIYVESDPFATQAKVDNGDAATIATLDAHTALFTFGENLGQPDCPLPLHGYRWLPTRQPVVTDLWDDGSEPPPEAAFTTITTWHNKGKDVEWRGSTWYWTKDREFERFLDLPQRRSNVPFELAVTLEPPVHERLAASGWRLQRSTDVSADPERYRDYIRSSRGEFTVARDQYVRPNTGWFSDRSACYLAAGRPVVTEETGFSKFLPAGEGLFGFSTIDDVLAAVDTIERDRKTAEDAAREIGRAYFAAETVVSDLLERALTRRSVA